MSVYTTVRTDFGTNIVDPEGEHVEEHMSAARAALLADALNVHEATGLTPSQLQARVAELEAAARYVRDNFKASEDAGYHTRDREFAISILTEALR